MTSSLHDGFSSATFEPVAQPFRGFRAFRIDMGHRDPRTVAPTNPPSPVDFASFAGGVLSSSAPGALRGIFKNEYAWGPGVNVASCLGNPGWLMLARGGTTALWPHEEPILADCDCGFWAYTSGDHFLSVNGPAAVGVVEAWGRMIIGPHGFRAEKARILGLTFPFVTAAEDDDDDEEVDREEPRASSQGTATVRLPRPGSFQAAGARVVHSLQSSLARALGAPAPPPITPPPAALNAHHPWELVTPELRERVRAMYPDVRFFDTVAALQAAFPLTDTRPMLPAAEETEEDA